MRHPTDNVDCRIYATKSIRVLNKILIVCNLVQNLNIIIFALVLTETFLSLFIRIRNCKWPLENENIYLNLNFFKIALGKKKRKK